MTLAQAIRDVSWERGFGFVRRVTSTRMPTPPFATGLQAVRWQGVRLSKRTGLVYWRAQSYRKNRVSFIGAGHSMLPIPKVCQSTG